MRVTVRLDNEQAEHVNAMRQDDDASDAAAVRNCIERSIRLSDIEQRRDDEVADLKADIEELREELQAERDRAQKFAGKLEARAETIDAKQQHIDSLESTIYEQQQAMRSAVDQRRGLLGTVRQALGSGRDGSALDDAGEDR